VAGRWHAGATRAAVAASRELAPAATTRPTVLARVAGAPRRASTDGDSRTGASEPCCVAWWDWRLRCGPGAAFGREGECATTASLLAAAACRSRICLRMRRLRRDRLSCGAGGTWPRAGGGWWPCGGEPPVGEAEAVVTEAEEQIRPGSGIRACGGGGAAASTGGTSECCKGAALPSTPAAAARICAAR